MTALRFPIYPRVVDTVNLALNHGERRAGSAVDALLMSPAKIPSGATAVRLRFKDLLPAPGGEYPESDPALCLQLRLLKVDDADNPTAADILTAADVGLSQPPATIPQVRVTVAWSPNPDVEFRNPTPFSTSFNTASGLFTIFDNGAGATGDNPVATLAVQFDSTSGLIRIYINPESFWSPPAEDFKLSLIVLNTTGQPLLGVFTVAGGIDAAGTPDETALSKAWLHFVPPAQITSQIDDRSAQIFNFGTTSGTTGPLASPELALGTALAGDPAITLTPSTLRVQPGPPSALIFHAPSGNGALSSTFTLPAGPDDPDPLGSTAPISVQLGDSLHRRTFPVTAQIGILELLMVLDTSGSMSWELGSSTTPPAGSGLRRWDYLVDALEAMKQLLHNHGAGADRLAVTLFPGSNTPTRRFGPGDMVAIIDEVLSNFGTAHNPSGGTPMRQGLDDGFNLYPGSVGINRRRLLLMTDGAWNTGGNPLANAAMLTKIRDNGVATVAVRLGNQAGLGQPTLQVMTSGVYNDPIIPVADRFTVSPPGALIEVNPPQSGVDVTPDVFNKNASFIVNLVAAASSVLGLRENADPTGVLTESERVKTHTFTLSELDRNATVFIGWYARDGERVECTLVSPCCERFTDGADENGVSFSRGLSFQEYHFDEAFLRGGDGCLRYGTWRLILRLREPRVPEGPIELTRGGGPLIPDSEGYDFRVWSDSALRLVAGLEPIVTTTDRDMVVKARFTNRDLGVRNANVKVELTRPTNSFAQFLASTHVDPKLLERVRREQEELGVIDPWEVKAAALAAAGEVFQSETEVVRFTLDEARVGGAYSRNIGKTCVPGNYSFRVLADAGRDAAVDLYSEASFGTRLISALDAKNTTVTLELDSPTSGRVCWRPRDACGNPVLYNPVLETPFRVQVKGGKFTGPPVALQDATYCQPVEFDADEPPVVIITPPDTDDPIITVELPHIPDLIWCDTVVHHRPGFNDKANQHNDPKAALGPFETPDQEFLALGAGGSVVLAASKANNPRQVCVIAREVPGDLRAYSVEICLSSHAPSHSSASKCQWLEVGRSEGITQCFSLDDVGGNRRAVVRVNDLSQRARNGTEFLSAPGAGVVAVGFVADPGAPAVELDDCVVGATSSLQLKDRCHLLEGTAPTGMLFNSGSGDVSIGNDTRLGTVFSTGDVRPGERVLIAGDVWTQGTFILPHPPPNPANPTVTGTGRTGVSALDLPDLKRFLVSFQPSNRNVDVQAGATATLQPGTYGRIQLAPRAKLVLAPGRYLCESLFVDVGARLDIAQSPQLVELQVRQAFTYRGAVATQKGKANLLLVTSATGTSFVESPLRGTVVSPHGTVRLQGGPPGSPRSKVHHGAFYAKNLVVEPDWSIVHIRR